MPAKFEFNKLDDNAISELLDEYEALYDKTCNEYGYDGDSPCYETIRVFMNDIRYRYEDEDFIQIAAEMGNGVYGWALHHLKNNAIQKDAYEFLKHRLTVDEDYLTKKEQDEILNDKTLPG